MADVRTYTRILDGEHVVAESDRLMSRDQIMLIADANRYQAGTVLAKLTAGGNAGKWCRFDPAGANGAAVAKGVLFAQRKSTAAPVRAVAHTRNCVVNGKKLTWLAGTTDPQKAAAIASLAGGNADGTGNVQVHY